MNASPPVDRTNVVDKRGRLAGIPREARVRLELGCGDRRSDPAAITVDIRDADAVDVVGDVLEVLSVIPDGSVDEVYSSHLAEHLADLGRLLREIGRVLKPGGTARTIVPHFSNPYFYSDPTHRSRFGLYTFSYYVNDRVLRREVPRYEPCEGLTLTGVRLVFKSSRVFPAQAAVRRIFEAVVNCSTYALEVYEANLCYLVPCYEIRYDVRKG